MKTLVLLERSYTGPLVGGCKGAAPPCHRNFAFGGHKRCNFITHFGQKLLYTHQIIEKKTWFSTDKPLLKINEQKTDVPLSARQKSHDPPPYSTGHPSGINNEQSLNDKYYRNGKLFVMAITSITSRYNDFDVDLQKCHSEWTTMTFC